MSAAIVATISNIPPEDSTLKNLKKGCFKLSKGSFISSFRCSFLVVINQCLVFNI